jgi:hypothetical protein
MTPLSPEQRGDIEKRKQEALRKRIAKTSLGPHFGAMPRRVLDSVLDSVFGFLDVATLACVVPCYKILRTRMHNYLVEKSKAAWAVSVGVGVDGGDEFLLNDVVSGGNRERFDISAVWCRFNELMVGLRRPRPVLRCGLTGRVGLAGVIDAMLPPDLGIFTRPYGAFGNLRSWLLPRFRCESQREAKEMVCKSEKNGNFGRHYLACSVLQCNYFQMVPFSPNPSNHANLNDHQTLLTLTPCL